MAAHLGGRVPAADAAAGGRAVPGVAQLADIWDALPPAGRRGVFDFGAEPGGASLARAAAAAADAPPPPATASADRRRVLAAGRLVLDLVAGRTSTDTLKGDTLAR